MEEHAEALYAQQLAQHARRELTSRLRSNIRNAQLRNAYNNAGDITRAGNAHNATRNNATENANNNAAHNNATETACNTQDISGSMNEVILVSK